MELRIVQGEPGIFPDPIARLLRLLTRPLRRGRREGVQEAPAEPAGSDERPDDERA